MNNKEEYLKKFSYKGKFKKDGFAMVPHSVLFDENLKKSDALTFWCLTVHMFKGKDYCFPSQSTIAKETKQSRRTVIRSINRLKKHGYLEVDKREGKSSKYYLKIKIN